MGGRAPVALPADAPEPDKPEKPEPEKPEKPERSALVAPVPAPRTMLAAVAARFGTEAAALTLLDAHHCEVWVCASNATARQAQDLEYTLGEGPSRDSTAANGAILVHGPRLRTRWRHYGPAVSQIGIEAVAAVPLPWSAGYLGALTVFDPARAVFDPSNPLAIGSLRAVAQDLAVAVLNAEAQPALLAEGDHRAQVHQAVGIVSVQCGCGVAEALLRLKAYSYAHGEGIGSVAARIVRHELRLNAS